MIAEEDIDREEVPMGITGKRFGRLVVRAEDKVRKPRHWLCVCDCGRQHTVRESALKNGHTQSCGCLGAERRLKAATEAKIKHGKSKSDIYSVWASMIQRCRDPNNKRWSSYGGRGISVCDRWLRFENFLADMGERPKGLTLDRVDVNGDYEPSNCRWATDKQQANNTRYNVRIVFDGKDQTIAEWAQQIGIPMRTLWARINISKMTPERALKSGDLRKRH